MTLALRYAVRSDVGLLREGNEDSAYAGPHLLAVADGMGGYEAGEVASAAVISSVAPLDRNQMPENELVEALSAAVSTAKQALRNIVEADPAVGSMGTTLTALLWSGETVAICHIGDSRAYLLRAGDFYQITRDHTFVQALIDQGRIRPEEAATHPQRSLLLRALDGRTDADPDLSVLTAETGDRFLLCSDGLPVAVSDEQILEVLSEVSEPSDAVMRLIELAIAGGGPDNITCIVADVIDTSQGQFIATKAPIVAGAAVSGAVNDTKPTASKGVDRDSGMTLIGAMPTGAADPGATSADGVKPARTRTRPGQLAPGITVNGTETSLPRAERLRRRARRRWPLMTSILALFVLLVAAGLFIGYQQIRSQYFVGTDKGNVVIFRGIQHKVLWFRLWSVAQVTSIPVSDLPASDVQGLGRTSFGSLATARQSLTTLRNDYQTCQRELAKLAYWKKHPTRQVQIGTVNGRPKFKTEPVTRPKISAACMTATAARPLASAP